MSAEATTEVCRSFRNSGSCRYGDECKFEHSEGDPIMAPNKPVGMCFTFTEEGKECKYGDRCRFRHGEGDTRFDAEGRRDLSKEICRNFQNGSCRFSDEECPRQHVEKPKRQPSGGSGDGGQQSEGGSGGKRRRNRRRAPRPVVKIDEVCNNYAAGKCRNGDNCRRIHEGDIVQTVEKIDEECKNFKAGTCRFGDLCRRHHVSGGGDAEASA